MSEPELQNAFEFHRARPFIRTDQYVSDHHEQLGIELVKRKRVYLDTNFWIMLRDVQLGRRRDNPSSSLLDILRHRASRGEVACPISASTFLELLRQQDAVTRRATADLIDQLSAGACLLPRTDRVALEMKYWTYSFLEYVNPRSVEHHAWTKLAFSFGVEIPYQTDLESRTDQAYQKTYFDHMWSLPLADAVESIVANTRPEDESKEKNEFDAVAQELNRENDARIRGLTNFAKVYREEFLELIESGISTAVETLHRDRDKRSPKHQAIRKEFDGDETARFGAILSEAAKGNALRKALRTSHIGAMCLATFRWDRQRKLTGNWLHDLHHAEAALGYCDVFLTEKPLAHLVRQENLGITRDFPCQVFSSPAEAVRALS